MSDLLREELAYVPEVQGKALRAKSFVCGGMGGSALPALILNFLEVPHQVLVHRDYALPTEVPDESAYIAISYSGNTEETLSFAREAREKGLPLGIVTGGGALLDFAKEQKLPHVIVPVFAQPRDAVIATTKALLALIGEKKLLKELSDTAFASDNLEKEIKEQAKSLAKELQNSVPIFYASTRNEVLAYIAKIQCEETAKSPAFSNVFPELDHNELQGFDSSNKSASLTKPFVAVFLTDVSDDERIKHRMVITEKLLEGKNVRTLQVPLKGSTRAETFIATWFFARTLARALAEAYNVDPDATPLVEELKKSLKESS